MRSGSASWRWVGWGTRLIPLCSATLSGLSLAHVGAALLLPFLFGACQWIVRFGLCLSIFLALKFLADAPSHIWEWGKSASLLALNVSLLFALGFVSTSSLQARYAADHLISLKRWFIFVMALHGGFLVLQFVVFETKGDFYLLNPLGEFSPPGPDPTTAELSVYNPRLQDVKRPNGLAWEPSVAGLWQLCGLALFLTERRPLPLGPVLFGLMIAGVLVTRSLVADIGLYVMLVHWITIRHLGGWPVAFFGYPFLAVVTILGFSLAGSQLGLAERVAEIFVPGSSAYLRLHAPLELVRERGLSWLGDEALGARTFSQLSFFRGLDSPLSGIPNLFLEAYVYLGLVGLISLVAIMVRLYRRLLLAPAMLALLVIFPFFGGNVFNTLGLYPLVLVLVLHFATADPDMGRSA